MDAATFHDLYEAHARHVFRFARYLVGDADVASDITAETFLRAWAGRAAIRVATARAYLLAIARNLAKDEGRRRRRFPAADVPDRQANEDATARLELRETLQAMRALPVEYREPLALAAAGLGYDEIGRVLGLSLATVKIRVHRARLRLASALQQAGGAGKGNTGSGGER